MLINMEKVAKKGAAIESWLVTDIPDARAPAMTLAPDAR
jgi:hypothetical protein